MHISRIALVAFPILLYAFAADAAEPGGLSSLWTKTTIWLLEQQRTYHRELTQALKLLSKEGSWAATGALILGSFLYGVFHAAGPGHGKAVLTSYLLSHGENLGRSLLMATLAAFCQGIVAILLVYGLVYIAGWLPRETSSAVQWSERFSYFLVAALGAWLSYRALKMGYTSRGGRSADNHHSHSHGGHSGSCGHTHLPDANQLSTAGDWKSILGIVLSIGMRPCSGAILVLVFANAFGIAWSGISAFFAMSAGTAITIACLALLAVKARNLASALSQRSAGHLTLATAAIAFLGGIFILAIGIGLLSLSFKGAHPLGL